MSPTSVEVGSQQIIVIFVSAPAVVAVVHVTQVGLGRVCLGHLKVKSLLVRVEFSLFLREVSLVETSA